MITDKITWPKHYNNALADYNVVAEVAADDITAEQLWPFLTNLSDLMKVNNEYVDAAPVDSGVSDPHLFKDEIFTLATDAYKATVKVIETVEPKGDRPGRLCWEGEGVLNSTGETFAFVHLWVLDVEKGKNLNVISALAVNGKVLDENYFADLNQRYLSGIVKYARNKITHTNHPVHPSTAHKQV